MIKQGNTVKVHYTGKLEDNSVFDSSDGREPIEFQVGSQQVIEGFESAVNGEHSYLEELWNNKDKIIGLTATVRYFGLTTTENPVPRFPKVISIGRETYE